MLQDEMMLFGPCCIMYPLQVAYASFMRCNNLKCSQLEVGQDIAYVKTAITRFKELGLRAAASYILGDFEYESFPASS